MFDWLRKKNNSPSPEEVPPDHLSPLSRKYLDWKTGMVVVIGVLLIFTFINTFITNPTISGYSVVDVNTQDTERFSGMTSLLVLVFGFFGLFILLVTRKFHKRE